MSTICFIQAICGNSIGANTFTIFTNLIEFGIENNQLSEFDAKSLSKHLKYLYVAGNDLKKIKFGITTKIARNFNSIKSISV